MKTWLGLLALFALTIAGAAITLTSGVLTLSLPELEARYRLPNSQFLEVDGVRVHYVDEGSGPALVLLHASFMSLHSWNDLAHRLEDRYRVVRLDQLTNGLTGADTNNDYSLQHNEKLLAAVLAHLGIEEFFLLGTSSGGTTAFRYAATHPAQVKRLILVNSAGLPRTAVTDPNRARGSALDRWIQSYYKSRTYWRDNLGKQFGGGSSPPDDLVERVYDMNRRNTLRDEGGAMMRQFKTGDPESVLAEIRVPTLVLWGMGNITVDHLQADVFEHWLYNAPTLKKKYPKVGHYLYLEIPDEFAQDVDTFLSGKLDEQLIRVTRTVGAAPAPNNQPAQSKGV